jgi:hypothetical protein
MVMRWRLITTVFLLPFWMARADGSEAPRAQTPTVQASVQVLGPFAIGPGPEGQVSIRTTTETLQRAPATVWGQTLTRFEILDGRGQLLYLENLQTVLTPPEGFSEEVSLDAAVIRGKDRRYLLLFMGFDPSAPNGGTIYHFFGFDQQGRFKRFGAPITQNGTGLMNPVDQKQKMVDLIEGKYLEFGEWTGTFSQILRWQFVEQTQAFEPVKLCGRVEVQPQTPEEATIFLYASPGPKFSRQSVRVSATSRIEFLEGCRNYGVSDPTKYAPWLRIRIDGKEGWVPYEDTPKLGLPESG